MSTARGNERKWRTRAGALGESGLGGPQMTAVAERRVAVVTPRPRRVTNVRVISKIVILLCLSVGQSEEHKLATN